MTTKTDTNGTIEYVLSELVTVHDVAERIGVPRVTIEKWIQRSKVYVNDTENPGWAFPEPRLTLANGRTKLWLFDLDIVPWLTFTGREHYLEGKLTADEPAPKAKTNGRRKAEPKVSTHTKALASLLP